MTAAMLGIGFLGLIANSTSAKAHDFDEDESWRRTEWREHQWREQRWREQEWREHARDRYAPPREAYTAPSYYV